jgi:hypothetical protein
LNVTKPLAKSVVKACVVLHNLVTEMDGAHNEDLSENEGFMTLRGLSKKYPTFGREKYIT